jgi:hypothetical protein
MASPQRQELGRMRTDDQESRMISALLEHSVQSTGTAFAGVQINRDVQARPQADRRSAIYPQINIQSSSFSSSTQNEIQHC